MQRNEESKSMSSSMFFPSKPGLSLNQMCIVFDIDDTLTSVVQADKPLGSHASYLKFMKEYHPEYIIPLTIQGTTFDHILLPGAIEAVQFLLKAGCCVAFYSHGMEERNQLFTTELLKRAFSPPDFQKYRDCVKVFSREKHFVRATEDNQPKIGWAQGNYKKDLNFVIDAFAKTGMKFSLDQIVLIDDDLSWMLKGQEKNFLKVKGCSNYDIQNTLSSFLSENKINHIFYAMGLLSTILKSSAPLNTLFDLQFRDLGPSDFDYRILKKAYKVYIDSLRSEPQYYKLGLELLRTVNKNLQLMDDSYINERMLSTKKVFVPTLR